ncbi:MAG: PIN domain-containing protein, partial [Nanoarchaeota archaeon]
MIKKQILLDTNFILSCIREKLDLFEYLEERNFKIIIPKQVIDEIKEIQNSKKKFKYKNEAEIALK